MKTLLILITILGTILSATAQDTGKIGVKLNISGQSGLEGEVRSYFTREFRSIGDVEIVDTQALVVVSLVIIETRNKGGQRTGYAVSVAITDKTPVIIVAAAGASATTNQEKQKQIMQTVPEGGILIDHILQVFDSDSLAKTCKQLAAQIDGSHLENVRKMRRELQKQIQKNQGK